MSTLLDIQHTSLNIPGLDKPILNNINYQVNSGDFIIILGSNGSGKSSLLKLLDRRYQATAGQILLNNKPLEQYTIKQFSETVITITQDTKDSLFPSLTIFENYLLVKKNIRSKNEERNFFSEYLFPFNPNLSKKLDQIVEKLSGGEKQALVLALSMLNPPRLLLLDEHTSALDPKSAQQLMQLTQQVVKKHQVTCLLTTHDLEIALQYGNRILSLRQGSIHQSIQDQEKSKLTEQILLNVCY